MMLFCAARALARRLDGARATYEVSTLFVLYTAAQGIAALLIVHLGPRLAM